MDVVVRLLQADSSEEGVEEPVEGDDVLVEGVIWELMGFSEGVYDEMSCSVGKTSGAVGDIGLEEAILGEGKGRRRME